MMVLCANPTCKKRLRVDDARAGKRVSCPACRTMLVAPQPGSKAEVSPVRRGASFEVGS
jgi:hypothetical protein